jgi:hypothetical protein
VWHFFMASSDYDRALYVHDGEAVRDEMARHFAAWSKIEGVRVRAVEALDDGAVIVEAVVSAGGEERPWELVLRKGDPAWPVDWPATRALWE